jgi:propanediol dehydratase large subunit
MLMDSVSAKILILVTNVKIVLLNITTLRTVATLVTVTRTAQWTKIVMPMENVPARKTLLETSAM